MSDQIFKSPGFYDREIDLSARTVEPSGIPAAIVGTSQKGPAFVPVTLGSFADFQSKFGDLNPKFAAPYAVQKWLDNRFAATFVRVLGGGANSTQTEFDNTRTKGVVKNAGFSISGSAVGAGDLRYKGSTQFIVAKHVVTGTEVYGLPMFSDNSSFFTTGSSTDVYLVRGMVFTAYDTRLMIMSASDTFSGALDDFATLDSASTSVTYKKFKLVLSSSSGSSFGNTDGYAGVRIMTASLNPTSPDYIAKILNTDPEKFETERHVLYCDFAVDDEIATVSTASNCVGVVSGSSNTSANSGDTSLTLRDAFGRFDTRFTTPKTTWLISQPFGATEYNLFYFESLDDGAYANQKYKISIANLRASSDPKYLFGTFTVLVRAFDDTDIEPMVIEQYNNVSLDPDADNYIAKVIGDIKVSYSFDTLDPEDRRLTKEGQNPNRSKLIRVVVSDQVTRKTIPGNALPFGFRGFGFLNTSHTGNDGLPVGGISGSFIRLAASGTTDDRLLSAMLPPLPFRFKVTRGEVSASAGFEGQPGANEVVDSRYFWGVKGERNVNVLNPNISNEPNALVGALTKFHGIEKLDVLVTGSKADTFNDNKFTLARVCLSNITLADVTASAETHMKETAYIRNGTVDPSDYTVTDTNGARVTLATLLMKGSTAAVFNQFSDYAKFTTVMAGGFDGVNILDKNAARLNDKATSTESGGGANGSFTSPGFSSNLTGTGKANASIFSYQTAVKIITDPLISQHNILVVPGIREPFVTDDAATKTAEHTLSMYIMDIPYYDFNGTRIFDGDSGRYTDSDETKDVFDARAIDNDAVTAAFPNTTIEDTTNGRNVIVPASAVTLSAFGYNDRVGYPWFAPAGFNRAALGFVKGTTARLNQPERDRLIAARINPIVRYPQAGFVIPSQMTLKQGKSSLTSTNVKRMILEAKRSIVEIGNKLMFENMTVSLRTELVKQYNAVLSSIQAKGGLQAFVVICDDSNNTQVDIDSNQMNVQIRLLPTLAVEFIAIDFIVTQSGVQFT